MTNALIKVFVVFFRSDYLISQAPLSVNINDKGTAFGGSLATMNIISSWGLCWIIQKELGFNSSNIVIIKNEHSYKKPVTKDIVCFTKKPSLEEIDKLKNKLLSKKSASIKIESKIIEDGEICVDFTGYYVIKI